MNIDRHFVVLVILCYISYFIYFTTILFWKSLITNQKNSSLQFYKRLCRRSLKVPIAKFPFHCYFLLKKLLFPLLLTSRFHKWLLLLKRKSTLILVTSSPPNLYEPQYVGWSLNWWIIIVNQSQDAPSPIIKQSSKITDWVETSHSG